MYEIRNSQGMPLFVFSDMKFYYRKEDEVMLKDFVELLGNDGKQNIGQNYFQVDAKKLAVKVCDLFDDKFMDYLIIMLVGQPDVPLHLNNWVDEKTKTIDFLNKLHVSLRILGLSGSNTKSNEIFEIPTEFISILRGNKWIVLKISKFYIDIKGMLTLWENKTSEKLFLTNCEIQINSSKIEKLKKKEKKKRNQRDQTSLEIYLTNTSIVDKMYPDSSQDRLENWKTLIEIFGFVNYKRMINLIYIDNINEQEAKELKNTMDTIKFKKCIKLKYKYQGNKYVYTQNGPVMC